METGKQRSFVLDIVDLKFKLNIVLKNPAYNK